MREAAALEATDDEVPIHHRPRLSLCNGYVSLEHVLLGAGHWGAGFHEDPRAPTVCKLEFELDCGTLLHPRERFTRERALNRCIEVVEANRTFDS